MQAKENREIVKLLPYVLFKELKEGADIILMKDRHIVSENEEEWFTGDSECEDGQWVRSKMM